MTIDEAIQLAIRHNHNLLAGRATIQQNQSQETTANLRPNLAALGGNMVHHFVHDAAELIDNSVGNVNGYAH